MADQEPRRTFDVHRPGRGPMAATSRPVIVTNRPIVRDPTLKHEDTPVDEEKKPDEPLTHTAAKTIVPVNENLGADPTPTTEQGSDQPSMAQEEAEIPDNQPANEASSEVPPTAPATISAAQGDDQVNPGQADQKKQVEQTEEEKAREQQVRELAASGKYVVQVGHIERNQKYRKVALILVVIAAVAAVVFMAASM